MYPSEKKANSENKIETNENNKKKKKRIENKVVNTACICAILRSSSGRKCETLGPTLALICGEDTAPLNEYPFNNNNDYYFFSLFSLERKTEKKKKITKKKTIAFEISLLSKTKRFGYEKKMKE